MARRPLRLLFDAGRVWDVPARTATHNTHSAKYMKNHFLSTLAVATTFAFSAAIPTALAVPVQWTLTGVTFDDGTTATGGFTYDADTNLTTNWSIATQAGTLPALTYNPANSNSTSRTASSSMFQVKPFGRYVIFNYPTNLTNAGGSVSIRTADSYDCSNCGIFRRVTAGTVVGATPAPVTPASIPTLSEWGLVLMAGIVGLFGFGFMRRRG